MEGAVELAEEVFHVPVRLGIPQGVTGLGDVVRNPMNATGVGLLLFARAQFAEGLNLASGQKASLTEAFAQSGTCPDNASAESVGIPVSTDITGNYVQSVTVGGTADVSGNCTITALFKSTGVSTGLAGQSVTLTMGNADKGSVTWRCTSSANQRYLPQSCESQA